VLLDPDAGSSSGSSGLHGHGSDDVAAAAAPPFSTTADPLMGISRQVQVLLSLDSRASWGFVAGCAPVFAPVMTTLVTVIGVTTWYQWRLLLRLGKWGLVAYLSWALLVRLKDWAQWTWKKTAKFRVKMAGFVCRYAGR